MKPFWEQTYFIKIVQWKPVAILIVWLKKIILPGFDNLPLFDVLVFFLKGLIKGSIAQRASSIAYNFFLALFPTLLFFFTLVPYIPIDDFHSKLMDFLQMNLPDSAFQTIYSTVNDILSKPRGGLLSVGILMAIFFSTNGFKSIMAAFNMSYHYVESRTYIKTQLTAFLLVLISTMMMIISISLITFSNFILDWLVLKEYLKQDLNYYLILFAQNIIQLAMIYFLTSFIYFLAPSKKNRFKFFSAGSTFATLLYVLSYFGFNYYITHFSRYNALYGSIGTIIIFLIWIYFIATILLIGFELNISIKHGKVVQQLKKKV